jgi:hypothetical protein
VEPEVIIVTGEKVLRVPQHVWSAFLKVAALVVDSGDMYPYFENELGESMLDQVKDMKYAMDDHMITSRLLFDPS